MDIVEELLALTEALEKGHVDYAVCGGLAMTIHGRPRLTIDIDLVIPKPTMNDAIQAARSVGFDIDSGWVALPTQGLGIDRLYRLTKVQEHEFLSLDLLEVDSPANPLFADRAIVSLGDRQLSVLTRNSLIDMKSRSHRTKDRLDVELLHDEEATSE
jgi:hypothetical protein